ncbi:hypothetical protein AX14_007795 [Amanita brunnescens Koide BX004]|nr:hypothetical protein AX14_007795 [Amanita brunnescens Koide BX004]
MSIGDVLDLAFAALPTPALSPTFMQIRFNPDIGQTITVSPPLLSSNAASYVVVRFTALIPNSDYGQMDEEGTKVQLWSNSGGGEWKAHDLTNSTQVTKIDTNQQQLLLDLPVILPPGLPQLAFDYTYRILLSDGRIIWLGRFGQNGVCFVHRLGPYAILSGDWHSKDGIVYELETDGISRSVEVLRGINMDDIRVHALNPDGAPGFRDQCSLLFILPKYLSESCAAPQAFSVSSSAATSMSLGSAGSICINSDVKTSLLLQVYDNQTDLFPKVQRAVTHSFAGQNRILFYKNGIVVFRSSTVHQHPLRLVAIGLSATTEERVADLQLELSEPFETFAEGFNTLCLYPRLQEIPIPPDNTSIVADIQMELGSQYTLSPEYPFRSRGGSWRLSILSDYTNIRTSFHDPPDCVLPTPPPSPPSPSEETVVPLQPTGSPATKFYAKSSRLHGYMRYVFIFMFAPIYITSRIWSIVRSLLGGSRKQEKIDGGLDGTRGANGLAEDKDDHHSSASTPSQAIQLVPLHREGLRACVFPGLLTILLRTEGSTTNNPLDMLSMKLDGEQLDSTIEHINSSTFLFKAHVDRDGEIEITSV